MHAARFSSHDNAPALCFRYVITQGLSNRIERQLPVGKSLGKLQTAHLILLVGAYSPVRPTKAVARHWLLLLKDTAKGERCVGEPHSDSRFDCLTSPRPRSTWILLFES